MVPTFIQIGQSMPKEQKQFGTISRFVRVILAQGPC